MKILSVFGTRPEAIKMAPLVEQLTRTNAKTQVCVTAQHREMLDQVMDFFQLSADFDLDLMRPGQTLSGLYSRVLTGLDDVLVEAKPDLVLVHGDTSTACAAAMASFHRQIPVAHVEAGLRSGDLKAPFPEEMNRVVIDSFADHLWAPTQASAQALLSEGRPKERVVITGNTVIDALNLGTRRLEQDDFLRESIDANLPAFDESKKLVLITGHRRESFGYGFERLCQAITTLAKRSDIEFVYPVHLNPNVRGPVHDALGALPNVHLIEPLEYPAFLRLMQLCHMVITDSGGVQEEAPSLGKPVLVTRDVTERQEAVDAGAVVLVGTNAELIVENTTRLLDDSQYYDQMSGVNNPYGDGLASLRIVQSLGLGTGYDQIAPFADFEG